MRQFRWLGWATVGLAAASALLAGWRTWPMFASADPRRIALGAAIVITPVIGLWLLWLLWRGLSDALSVRRMKQALLEEPRGMPDDLPHRPSGRPIRDAADVRFGFVLRDVERQPSDWRAWFRLGLAYQDAGDRRRARKAMRQAGTLFDRQTR